MRQRRVIRKDEYIGVRMPRADRERLETAARSFRRDTSELVWSLAMERLDQVFPLTHQPQPQFAATPTR